MLTGRQVRDILGISKRRFLELVREGELAAIRTGSAPNSHYRVSEKSLDEFITRQRVTPDREKAVIS